MINCDNIVTIAKDRLDPRPIGRLDPVSRARLDRTVRYSLDILY